MRNVLFAQQTWSSANLLFGRVKQQIHVVISKDKRPESSVAPIGVLSEHPKAAIQEHLKSGHTFRRNVQDIDSSGRVSSLSQHGNRTSTDYGSVASFLA
jgi:hypothetical protein